MYNPEELLQPVSADSPAGENCSYDDAYSELSELIENAPSGETLPEEKRWALIGEKSAELLKTSKHITVAAYCAIAGIHGNFAEGIIPGLQLFTGICENFWESMHPPRERARRNCTEWFIDNLAKLMPQGNPPLLEPEVAADVSNHYTIFKALMEEKFTEEPLMFNELDRCVAELVAAASEEEEEAQAAAATQGEEAGANDEAETETSESANTANTTTTTVRVIDSVETAFQKADTLLGKGNVPKAFKVLVDGLQTASGGREEMRWRIALCELMLKAAVPQELIRIHIANIGKSLDDFKLAQWEPQLATRALEVSCKFWKYAGKSDKMGECLEQLSIINAASAFSVLT